MSFLSAMNISASGMTAQRMRLDVVSENVANIDTTRTGAGTPYRRKMVVLESREGSSFKRILRDAASRVAVKANYSGVQVAEVIEDNSEFKPVYDPDHPDAGEDGYVLMPNVDLMKETVDGMSATRSYDANITAFNAIKAMAQKGLEIGR